MAGQVYHGPIIFLTMSPIRKQFPVRNAEREPSDEKGEAILGRALYRSVVVLSLLAAAVLAVFFWQSRREGSPSDSVAPSESASVLAASSASIPTVRFTDVTDAAGIHFRHNNGACGEKLLPETMGGGLAFFDYDLDGDPDLLFINGTTWPECPTNHGAASTTAALYRNDTEPGGPIRFTDVTAGSGLDVPLYGMGVATGDYDNDGLADVFITAVGANHLFKNLGRGRFADVTAAAGVGGEPGAWSTSACWFDYDNDGDLDLFVCHYVQWSRKLDLAVHYQLAGLGKAYGPPYDFAGTFPQLYRNEGRGSFTDVTAQAGLDVTNRATGQPLAKSLGVTPVDVDDDGWMDIVVANDTVQNLVFRNQRNGTFAEVGATAGLAFDSYGGTRGAMGIDSARAGRDSELAIAIGNFANETTALYVSQPLPFANRPETRLQFSDEAINQGIGSASRPALTFGVFFFDYDLDGWEDLLTVNGHIEPDIQRVDRSQTYGQSAQLFWNAHSQTKGFLPVPPDRAGPDLFQPMVGRGSAFADVDLDGDLDVAVTQVGGPARLFRNDQNLHHGWLRLKLIGIESNRDAIGAKIQFQCAGRTRWRRVMPTRGYLSQSELPVTLGLGDAVSVESIEISWPGGASQAVRVEGSNQTVVVKQDR
jgi:enediyne biosynthesis protein E4